MRTRMRIAIAVAGAVTTTAALVSGCTSPTPPGSPTETYPPSPDTRTHWALRHRIADTTGLQVIGQRLGHGEESTEVAVAATAHAPADDCFVSLSVPGQGGPDTMVGDQITTTFGGHPAVRNGAGAEGDYLFWQLEDQSWFEVICTKPGSATINRVAAAVELKPTTMRIPVDVEVPAGYGPAILEVDLRRASSRIHLGVVGRHPWPPEADLVIMVNTPELSPPSSGAATELGGRPAQIVDNREHPAVWVQEQGSWVLVAAETGDTGPCPDRSSDLPVLTSMATSLTFAPSLSDPRTWFPADAVFG